MADIDDFTKQGGMFLKADDVINSREKSFVITGEATLVEDERFGGQRLHVPGNFGGEAKTFNCSRTNSRTISEKLTPETTKWVGAILVLETYRTKIADGRMVDAINVREVRGGTPAESVAEPAPAESPTESPAESTA